MQEIGVSPATPSRRRKRELYPKPMEKEESNVDKEHLNSPISEAG